MTRFVDPRAAALDGKPDAFVEHASEGPYFSGLPERLRQMAKKQGSVVDNVASNRRNWGSKCRDLSRSVAIGRDRVPDSPQDATDRHRSIHPAEFFEYSTDQQNWVALKNTHHPRVEISGLVSGQVYYFGFSALVGDEEREPCAVVNHKVR